MTIYDCPPMSWNEFLSIPDGTTVFNHGASECVALANLYNEGVLGGGFVAVGSAIQWWTNPNVAPVHGFTQISSNPQVGDIFIGSYGVYDARFGHIGVVVRAWDGSTFGTMEQNVRGQFVSRHDRTMANIDGFLRPINQAPLVTIPVLTGNQRMTGPNGVFRRAEPSSQSERLQPDLEANEVGNFVGWIYGENVSGNNIWFQGISGNWFWSGAFTDSGTHDLADLNPVPPQPEPVEEIIVSTPEPVIEPVEEVDKVDTKVEEKPVVVENEEKPVAKLTEQEIAEINARQKAVFDSVGAPVDLGAIITNAKARKVVWAIYGLVGLGIIGLMGGMTAAQWIAPEWFIFATGSYTAIGPAFASLAMANITTKK